MAKKKTIQRAAPKAAKKATPRKKTTKKTARRPAKKSPKKSSSPASSPGQKPAAPPPPSYAEREQERKARYATRRRSANADIGSIPEITKEFAELREACRHDLELWHTEVFKKTTGLKPFGEVQKQSIGISKMVLEDGGLINRLEPRGYGKTSRTVNEAIFALCYGLRRFVGMCGSNADKTGDIFEGIKVEIETNDILFGMFPEIMYPLRMLDGKPQKARSQHICGVPTNICYESDKIVFPTVEGSLASGSIICVKSIKNVRGIQHRTAELGVIRPDLYLLDDIQTTEGAASDTVRRKLLGYIKKDVMFGGNPADDLAVMNLATIIEPDDVPDQLSRDPAWDTIKYARLVTPAKNEDFWFGPYQQTLLNFEKHADPQITKRNREKAAAKARDLYIKNKKMASEGASVSWEWGYPWRSKKNLVVDAIQNAYNLMIMLGKEAFACECQNDPIRVSTDTAEISKVTKKQLKNAVISVPKGIVPVDHDRLVAYVDTHSNLYYWAVVSKNLREDQLSRHLVSCGTWPAQKDRYFSLEKAAVTIPKMKQYKNLGPKTRVAKSLKDFLKEFFRIPWKTQNGNRMLLDEVRVDANWGTMTKTIEKVLREHEHKHLLWASFGRGIPETKVAMNDWQRKTGQTKGDGYIKNKQTSKANQTLLVDTNQWKTETHTALSTDGEEAGSLTIFEESFLMLEMLFDHLLVENCERKSGVRDCEIWKNPKGGQNHWFDCLVGAMVDDMIVGAAPETSREDRTDLSFDVGL